MHVVEQEDGTLLGLTPTGRFHIERLRLNRAPLVAYRRELRRLEAARETQARLVARLKEIDIQVQSLISQLESLERDGQG